MQKILYPILLLIFLAVAGITFLTIAAPTGLIRDQLVTLVKQKTGRDLVINGETSFSVFPNLGVELTDVSFSGPASAPGRHVLKMDRLTANVSLLPLIRQKIEVNSFVLKRPVFDLWIDKRGVPSWEFAANAQTPARRHARAHQQPRLIRVADKELPPELQDFVRNSGGNAGAQQSAQKLEGLFQDLRLEQVKIEKGSARYEDMREGTLHEVDEVDLQLELDTLEDPLNAEGALRWKKELLNFEARLASPKNILSGHSSDLDLSISGKPTTVKFDGSVALTEALTVNGKLVASTPALDRLLNWVAPGSSGSLGGRGSIDADITANQNRTDLNKIKISLRGVRGTGDVSISTKGERPNITGEIHLADLNISQLLSGGQNTLGTVPTSRGGTPDLSKLIGAKAKRSPDHVRIAQAGATAWSRAPIDVSALNTVDAQLVLTVDRMNHHKIKMTDSRLVTLLNRGLLRLNVEKISLYGGRGTGRITVDGGRNLPQVSASMLINGVSALPLLKDAAEFDWIDAKGRIELNVGGRGKSEEAIIRSLAGDGRITFKDGAIVGVNIPQLVRGFQSGQFSNFTKSSSQKTDFSELSGTFTIANGVATNSDLQLVGPLLRMAGTGQVNIPQRSVNYRLNPKLVASLEGQGGNASAGGIELPLIVSGPWASPSITPDLQGILANPEKTVDSAKQMIDGIKKKIEGGDVEGVLKGLFGGQ